MDNHHNSNFHNDTLHPFIIEFGFGKAGRSTDAIGGSDGGVVSAVGGDFNCGGAVVEEGEGAKGGWVCWCWERGECTGADGE